MTKVDPTRCPLCGGDNECALLAGGGTCWCFSAKLAPEACERVPEAARGVACVCRACGTGERPRRAVLARALDLLRRR
ncbi:cysteine-rich CWC family protein [Sandaracinus amylolyticus]|uniref:cysteine-rich CWC family protein n=1 Tax=Sandaracinus amylolyticus TaxID=927083 RepID=UPI001F3D9B5F|nr:cysteine-rich CWC family protein [Sandaracinus amylolyticus]UJR82703.1 Hypothetical protein I5071_47680 [Sandaracinus amylolyticus]